MGMVIREGRLVGLVVKGAVWEGLQVIGIIGVSRVSMGSTRRIEKWSYSLLGWGRDMSGGCCRLGIVMSVKSGRNRNDESMIFAWKWFDGRRARINWEFALFGRVLCFATHVGGLRLTSLNRCCSAY